MSRHVGFAVEATYGTPVAPTDFSEVLTETIQKEHTAEDIITVRANSVLKTPLLTSKIAGDIEVAGNYQDLALLFKAFMGSADYTDAPPDTHTFPATAGTTGRTGVSVTCEIKRETTAATFRYAGCKVVGWAMKVSQDQSPRHTFSFVGKSEATGTAATASYPTFDPMLVGDTAFSFVGDASGTPADVSELTINATWPVDEPYKIGSSSFAVEPLENGPLAVEGTVRLVEPDMAVYADFDGETEKDIQIVCDDGTHSITINMNKCIFTAVPTNMSGRERPVQTYTFRSIFDATATENLQIILVNDDATDYS